MDDLLLRAFRFEVSTQGNIAIGAWNRLTELAPQFAPPTPPAELGHLIIQAIAPMQQFIVASGVISLIVFPRPRQPSTSSGKRSIARGAELRRLWGVNRDSPLANRRLRNSLEHIDERLEEWIDSSSSLRFSPLAVVQDLSQLRASGGDAIRVWIGTVPWRFVVYGEEQNVELLAHEIRALLDRLGPVTSTFEVRRPN